MSATIMQDRLADKKPTGDSYTFFRRKGYELKPVTVDDW